MKKKTALSIVTLVLTVAIAMITLTGCPRKTINGLQIGFKAPRYNSISVGIKSENIEFDLDDITLNFYYGFRRVKVSELSDRKRYEQFIVLYFVRGEYVNNAVSALYDDYKNIEGFYFVKEIPLEEFNSSAYEVKNHNRPSGFAHSEQITVNREIIDSSTRSYFYFAVQVVIFDKQENKYEFSDQTSRINNRYANAVCIYSKVLDDNKVQLSEGHIEIG
ncbi:MAG: hypothetical protein LBT30_03860 [Clostridiales bacterium]|jgi:hypothetical protein|nr:hypothetical protein [Clostridiales bacterium]